MLRICGHGGLNSFRVRDAWRGVARSPPGMGLVFNYEDLNPYALPSSPLSAEPLYAMLPAPGLRLLILFFRGFLGASA